MPHGRPGRNISVSDGKDKLDVKINDFWNSDGRTHWLDGALQTDEGGFSTTTTKPPFTWWPGLQALGGGDKEEVGLRPLLKSPSSGFMLVACWMTWRNVHLERVGLDLPLCGPGVAAGLCLRTGLCPLPSCGGSWIGTDRIDLRLPRGPGSRGEWGGSLGLADAS